MTKLTRNKSLSSPNVFKMIKDSEQKNKVSIKRVNSSLSNKHTPY